MNTAPLPSVVLGDVLSILTRLESYHESITSLYQERWPAVRTPWVEAIRIKAEHEKTSLLAAAIAIARNSLSRNEAMVILAAAYDMGAREL